MMKRKRDADRLDQETLFLYHILVSIPFELCMLICQYCVASDWDEYQNKKRFSLNRENILDVKHCNGRWYIVTSVEIEVYDAYNFKLLCVSRHNAECQDKEIHISTPKFKDFGPTLILVDNFRERDSVLGNDNIDAKDYALPDTFKHRTFEFFEWTCNGTSHSPGDICSNMRSVELKSRALSGDDANMKHSRVQIHHRTVILFDVIRGRCTIASISIGSLGHAHVVPDTSFSLNLDPLNLRIHLIDSMVFSLIFNGFTLLNHKMCLNDASESRMEEFKNLQTAFEWHQRRLDNCIFRTTSLPGVFEYLFLANSRCRARTTQPLDVSWNHSDICDEQAILMTGTTGTSEMRQLSVLKGTKENWRMAYGSGVVCLWRYKQKKSSTIHFNV